MDKSGELTTMTVIKLGLFDPGSELADRRDYLRAIHEPTMLAMLKLRGERDGQWLPFERCESAEVARIQTFLKHAGFFPFGKIDGLCGYRTASSIRLFQEYVRVTEGDPSIGAADGVFGSKSKEHMQRWQRNGWRAEWIGVNASDPHPEYRKWMRLLHAAKSHYTDNPTTLLQKVAEFAGPSDTFPVSRWQFDPEDIHIIGVRRDESAPGKRQNDDLIVALINGLVFKFYGTTDPGKSSHRSGAPFLVHGQHDYRFGWHKMTDMDRVYRALKPFRHGVLIVRDADRDDALTDSDIEGTLEANDTINVHWGGKGVSNWSEGCQCICGRGYINFNGDKVDCSASAASRYAELGTKRNGVYQTKGAYSVLVDLVTAFSGSVHAAKYTLLYERDLDLDPAIGSAAARDILREIS